MLLQRNTACHHWKWIQGAFFFSSSIIWSISSNSNPMVDLKTSLEDLSELDCFFSFGLSLISSLSECFGGINRFVLR